MCPMRLALSDALASFNRCFIINPHFQTVTGASYVSDKGLPVGHIGAFPRSPADVTSDDAECAIWRHVRRTAWEIWARIAIHYAAHSLFKATERYVGGLILFGLERFITHYH